MPPGSPSPTPHTRQTWAALGLILLIGLGLRFALLDRLPPGIFGDETLVSLHARDAVANRALPSTSPRPMAAFTPPSST